MPYKGFVMFIRYETKGFADECFHPMAEDSLAAHGTMENGIRLLYCIIIIQGTFFLTVEP